VSDTERTNDEANAETDDDERTNDEANAETDDDERTNDEASDDHPTRTETNAGERTNAETSGRVDAGATAADGADGATREDLDPDVAVELELLRAENRRLRAAYQQAQRQTYRRTALGFLAVGALAALGGLAFPDVRSVLFALAGAGLFAGVLAYYLTPERFVAADVAHDVYGAFADVGERLVDELGLTTRRLYVPTDGAQTAWLYVPQSRAGEVPDDASLESLFVLGTGDHSRGVSLRPAGGALFERFERALSGSLAADPTALATQLADGVVEQFELARGVHADVSPRGDAGATGANGASGDGDPAAVVSFGVTDPTIGSLDRFDHPIPSFLAVGLARGVDAPVAVETTAADGDRADFVVTCRVEAAGQD
jgi:hypothetical protein